jgi:hypothetical protein
MRLTEEFVGIYTQSAPAWKAVEILYLPLITLSDSWQPVGSFFEWYIYQL